MYSRKIMRIEAKKIWEQVLSRAEKTSMLEKSHYSSTQGIVKHLKVKEGFINEKLQKAFEELFTEKEFNAMYQLVHGKPFSEQGQMGDSLPEVIDEAFINNFDNILGRVYKAASGDCTVDDIKRLRKLIQKLDTALKGKQDYLENAFEYQ